MRFRSKLSCKSLRTKLCCHPSWSWRHVILVLIKSNAGACTLKCYLCVSKYTPNGKSSLTKWCQERFMNGSQKPSTREQIKPLAHSRWPMGTVHLNKSCKLRLLIFIGSMKEVQLKSFIISTWQMFINIIYVDSTHNPWLLVMNELAGKWTSWSCMLLISMKLAAVAIIYLMALSWQVGITDTWYSIAQRNRGWCGLSVADSIFGWPSFKHNFSAWLYEWTTDWAIPSVSPSWWGDWHQAH